MEFHLQIPFLEAMKEVIRYCRIILTIKANTHFDRTNSVGGRRIGAPDISSYLSPTPLPSLPGSDTKEYSEPLLPTGSTSQTPK